MNDFGAFTTPSELDRSCLYIASVGRQRWSGNSSLLRRGHRYHLLMMTIEGAATGRVNDDSIYAEKNSIWLFPRNKTYTYTWDPQIKYWDYVWIEFDGDWANQFLAMMRLDKQHHFHNCEASLPLAKQIVETIHENQDGNLHHCLGIFTSLLATMEKNLIQPPRNTEARSIDTICKKFMADHLHNPIQLEDIAKHAKMSPFHLSRVFKEHNNISPIAYLRQLRVTRAKALFARHDMNISEIGQAVGYPVLQHFSRMFKAETGITPRAYLKSLD